MAAVRHTIIILLLLVAGCAAPPRDTPSPPPAPRLEPARPEAPPAPRSRGSFKVGEPYKIAGRWYYPKADWDYDRTGRASWYGRDFHGKLTANGETFDQNDLTAAHQTLPLPSMVRVTNLENGRSLILRVNDRGPFVHGRILDVSQKAARLLKFHDRGVTQVRIEVLEKESKAAAAEVGWRG